MSYVTVSRPELLDISAPYGRVYHGGSQMWYRSLWRRKAGCGPTVGANLIWYFARSREYDGRSLWDTGICDKAAFLSLMDEMFGFITPGIHGVNTTKLFKDGMSHFLNSRDSGVEFRILDVPRETGARPDKEEIKEFLLSAMNMDSPVAFLNLDNGKVRGLDKWHWVTIAAVDPCVLAAVMLDQGRKTEIDLDLWLRTTSLGGGFVALADRTGQY